MNTSWSFMVLTQEELGMNEATEEVIAREGNPGFCQRPVGREYQLVCSNLEDRGISRITLA